MAETEEISKSQTPEKPNAAPRSGTDSANVYLMKERFEINYGAPLEWLNNNGAVAYEVKDRISPQRALFALICDNAVPPRSSILPYLKSFDHANIMKLVEFGVVSWTPRKSRNMALIYERPVARVLDNSENIFKNNPDSFKSLMLSLLSAAEALKGHNITHRSIRPDNIYYKNESKTEIVVGDCAACFPAYYQPAAYETIESAMTQIEGRGNGTFKNDLYSLGTTALSFLLGKELFAGLTTPEILHFKLRKGSYSALNTEDKIPNIYAALFKGLLNDDDNQRWNYVQAYNSFEGKPVTFTNTSTQDKPKKSLTVNGEKVYTPRHVSYSMYNNIDEASEIITSGKILDWIRNGLEDEKLYSEVEKIIKQYKEAPYDKGLLVAKICIMIDPSAPIRLDTITVFPDGAPKAIFYALKRGDNLNPYIALFSSDLIKLWYLQQSNLRSPANAAEFKAYINRRDYGYGIERIMYDFDEDLPCVSPLLGDEFVNSSHRVLKALDDHYAKTKIAVMPFDRTILAYLRCKMGKKIDGIMIDINTGKPELQASAIIRLYTTMQNKYGPAEVPHLTQWLAAISQPIIKSYHNIKYQKLLEREIGKIVQSGKIIELQEILENNEAKEKDRSEYAKAMSEINMLLAEKNKIINGGPKLDKEARETAVKITSILAVLTMLASFVFNIINWVLQ